MVDYPNQGNTYDCGVFCVKGMEYFLRNPTIRPDEVKIPPINAAKERDLIYNILRKIPRLPSPPVNKADVKETIDLE